MGPSNKQEEEKVEVLHNGEEDWIMEATGHGAAGKLTGPSVVPRQEQ